MEMEDEKTTESNSADGDALTEDENLSEEQYEITVGDIDSGDLEIGRAHVLTPVTCQSRMPSSA